MKLTLRGDKDLEAEVLERCVRAFKLEGRHKGSGRAYRTILDSREAKRVLRYLADRLEVKLEN